MVGLFRISSNIYSYYKDMARYSYNLCCGSGADFWEYVLIDPAERHHFWPQLWLFFFSYLLKKEGRRKGLWIANIVIKSYAFLLDNAYLEGSSYGCGSMIFLLVSEPRFIENDPNLNSAKNVNLTDPHLWV